MRDARRLLLRHARFGYPRLPSAGHRARPLGHVGERATQRLEAESALVLVSRSCRGGARALPRPSELLAAGASEEQLKQLVGFGSLSGRRAGKILEFLEDLNQFGKSFFQFSKFEYWLAGVPVGHLLQYI